MKKKGWGWISLTLVLICLGAGIWIINSINDSDQETFQSPTPSPVPVIQPESTPPIAETQPPSITVPEIVLDPEESKDANNHGQIEEQVSKPTLQPPEPSILQPEKQDQHIEVPITEPVQTVKPTEPPKPQLKETEKPQTPDKPPSYEEKEVQPNKKQDEPKAGEKNSEGEVFVPGFGWIEEGGPNRGGQSKSDGDWNKQVGTMD